MKFWQIKRYSFLPYIHGIAYLNHNEFYPVTSTASVMQLIDIWIIKIFTYLFIRTSYIYVLFYFGRKYGNPCFLTKKVAICWPPGKIDGDRPRGISPSGELNTRGVAELAILDLSTAISQKRCKIGGTLLSVSYTHLTLPTNREV